MSEPPPGAKPGQVLSMTLTYLPALLSVVVQVALLILLFRHWGILDKAERSLQERQEVSVATKEASAALQKAVREETSRATAAMNLAIADAEKSAIANAKGTLNGWIADMKAAQPTYKVQIVVPDPPKPTPSIAPQSEPSGGRAEDAAPRDGELAPLPQVEPGLPTNPPSRVESSKLPQIPNPNRNPYPQPNMTPTPTRPKPGNNTGSPKQ